jgi:hypothetical protein
VELADMGVAAAQQLDVELRPRPRAAAPGRSAARPRTCCSRQDQKSSLAASRRSRLGRRRRAGRRGCARRRRRGAAAPVTTLAPSGASATLAVTSAQRPSLPARSSTFLRAPAAGKPGERCPEQGGASGQPAVFSAAIRSPVERRLQQLAQHRLQARQPVAIDRRDREGGARVSSM